jgi:hypothetical protein
LALAFVAIDGARRRGPRLIASTRRSLERRRSGAP